MKQSRIWELDALRGISILCVIGLHLLFDLQVFIGLPLLQHPLIQLINAAAGISFVTLSGLCVTLGKRPARRGLVVLGWAMAITIVTWVMAKLGVMDENLIIRFGVLHLLGVCMLLWPLFRSLPTWFFLVGSLVIIPLGTAAASIQTEIPWLFPLGLRTARFSSGDYFPLAPYLGWFFLGVFLGRTLYRNKQSLLPDFPCSFRFFRWCGRHSLLLYLIHQPILYGIIYLCI